jgi:1-acyl-sn-glycerol-3-phosphate acyltransferase
MIPARKSEGFVRFFSADAERRIKRSFDAVRVRGLAGIRAALARGPTLVVSNHTAWWDPLVALFVGVRLLGADAYALMDARNLERLPFFGNAGAIGVNLGDPADGARVIRYAAKLLAGTNRLLWVFAQGSEVPITVRPLGFRPGSGEIARLAGATVIPAALRYEMGSTPKPALWVSLGDPLASGVERRGAHHVHEERVTGELDRIDRAIAGVGADGFGGLHTRRPDPLFALAESTLAWLTRPRALR